MIFIIIGLIIFLQSFCFAQESDTTKTEEDFLNMSLEELLNIEIVTASKKGEKISDAPATAKVISAKQIEAYGWRDLKDVFKAIPGFDVSYDVQGEIRTLAIMRGVLGNQKLLILQDGQRQNPITGERYVFAHNMPLNIYKRIEIIYGPASALYGADAYAGVINLITKDGADINGFEINSGYISTGAYIGDITFGKKLDDVDVLVSGRIYNGQDYKLHEDYNDIIDYGNVNNYTGELGDVPKEYPIKNWNLLTKIKYNKLTFGADWQHTYESNALTTIPANYAYTSDNIWGQDIRHIYFDYEVIENENFNLNVNVTIGDYSVNPASNFTITSPDLSTFTPSYKYAYSSYIKESVQFSWEISYKLSLISGISFSNVKSFPKTQNLDNVPFQLNGELEDDLSAFVDDSLGYVFGIVNFTDSIFKTRNYNNFGSFVQLQFKPIEKLAITAGVRFDYNSIYDPTINPRIGIVYKPLDKLSLKALFGTAYIQPSNYYRWENWANPFAMHIPNTNISPEQLQSIEFSSGYYINDYLSLNVSIFRNDMTDIIRPVMANAQEGNYPYYNPLRTVIGEDANSGYVEINDNLGSMYSQGADIELNAQFLNILTSISYSYITGEIETNSTTEDIPKVSTHKINTNISYTYKNFTTAFTARYYTGIQASSGNSLYGIGGANEGVDIDGNFILYTNLSYRILDNLRANLSVDNILNTKHYGASPYGESVWIQPRAPQSLRKIYLGLNYSF